MDYYSGYINQLIEQLSHLPGIGVKTAQRLAFHIMNMPADQAKRLADSITEAKSHVQYCKCCQTLTDKELCPICANVKRDHSVIMVVETTQDLAAYEKPENTTAFTTSCTGPSPRCWGLGRTTSG